MDVIFTIILGLLMLTLFVVVHEWGHYAAAKKCGIAVLEFAIGFGPAIAKWKSKETQISLRVLPLGGFCKFLGDDEGDEKKAGSFYSVSVLKRFYTVVAGPAMNIFFAFIMTVIFLCAYGDGQPVIFAVEPGSPAQEAGLTKGDVITSMNGVRIDFMLDMQEALKQTDKDSMPITILREGESYSYQIPFMIQEDGSKKIGISNISYERKSFSVFEAVLLSFKWMFLLIKEMLAVLGNLIFKGQGLENLAGPVGTISIMGNVVKTGFENILRLASLISINLAVFNLLPFPALDGGKIVMLGVEAARKKPVPLKVEGYLNLTGFILIIAFAVYLTFQDIMRLAGG